MSALARFGRFWWEFVVGDDWIVAAGVALGLCGVYLLDRAGVSSWWLLPLVVAPLLWIALRRATRS
jgi:hypothetical protein